jgi:methylated-DNA-[protein]-cysteine S-methyltransferase
MPTSFQNKVYEACSKIPIGKVSTYKEIAIAIGNPKGARAIGNALNKNPFAPAVPCHRVVSSTGRLGGFATGSKNKAKLLEKEGVEIKDGRIVEFSSYFHKLV